jgi:hypothetical protein
MLHLALMGDQLRVLQTDHRLQGCGIESVQIGQQKRHLANARSMPHCWVLVIIKGASTPRNHKHNLRQSSPVAKSCQAFCARVKETLPLSACGHTNRPRSSLLENRQRPSPSNHNSLIRSPRRPRNGGAAHLQYPPRRRPHLNKKNPPAITEAGGINFLCPAIAKS